MRRKSRDNAEARLDRLESKGVIDLPLPEEELALPVAE